MNEDFIKNLKVNDQIVIIYDRDNSINIDKVIRLTKTMIISEKNGRFNKQGQDLGDSVWYKSYIKEPTKELLYDYYIIKYKNLIRHFIKKRYLNKLNLENLEQIYNILKKEEI